MAMDDVTQFNQSNYVKSVAAATASSGVTESDVSVTSVEYQVEQAYALQGTITDAQARTAVATLHSVPESDVSIMMSSRRLETARSLQATSFTAIVKTQSANAVKPIVDMFLDTQRHTAAFKTAMSLDADPVVTTSGTPTQKVQVQTVIQKASDAPIPAPSANQLTTELSTRFGYTATATVADVTQTAGPGSDELMGIDLACGLQYVSVLFMCLLALRAEPW